MRIAAIDIGTNSIHMVIADAVRHTEFEVVDREREVVQIGRGSFAGGRLRRDAIQRTALALRRFVQLARRQQVDKIVCTATAAVREAANGGEFLQTCREIAGLAPRVIPAEEEGRLIYLAVRSALRLEGEPSLIVDIGGGSVQLVIGDRERCHRVVSAPLGSLRLAERFLENDPPAPRELARLNREIRVRLRAALKRTGRLRPAQVYGSSGAIHALAHAAQWFERGETVKHLNGHRLSASSLERLVRKLEDMPLAQRERLPEIDAKRAEILVPGALVLLAVLDAVKADGITLSDFGLREGLVTDWLDHHAQEVSALERVDDLRMRSVLALQAKFGPGGPHPAHVAALSLALFDGLVHDHGLGAGEREMLHFAALLHDVGSAIGYDGHARHSCYVIQHGNLRGLTGDEVAIIANVARYHGKARPRRRDDGYGELPKRARRVIRWLSAILRVAEGLDRSHYQLIRDLRVAHRGSTVAVLVRARRDAQLEVWAGRTRTKELSRLLDADVRVGLDPRHDKRGREPLRAARGTSRTAAPPANGSEARTPAARLRARPLPPPVPLPLPSGRARRGARSGSSAGREAPPDRAPRRANAAVRATRETEH